ncbi:hypothetical protein IQ03_01332 [Gemmobacter caeni]|uniref:Large polyvalent protein-associated domain-containing protein n=1 Tax=Gemmobacter caeni TaxID=589035 RepID=A0A2T6B8N3_9RHOB|nr:LPD5 domain-containing protein [Gemmobacter caeni]PTX52416.1 hypothetical protein C8N34_102195 [Gemmobacter caeni]TWJ02913.1 hypothetical protein IQ03_01332 [Gemmobacter caeni]
MSRIEDFGAHLHGAAKERWRTYREAMSRARREAGDPLTAPLAEAFPEPPYTRLIEDGADPWVIAFVRAAREQIPARPRDPYRARPWARTVRALRDISVDLIEGVIDRGRVEARLADPGSQRLREGLEGRMALYLALGHERSLRGHRLTRTAYQVLDGVRHDPPLIRWEVRRDRSGGRAEVLASGRSEEEAITAFRTRLTTDAGAPAARRAPIEIFSWRGHPERGAVIGVKNGPHLIELARLPSVREAQTHLRENRNALERRLAQLRDLPPERGEANRDRSGPALRRGDVSPARFQELFGFRGVQFGNYVEGARRQADLNRAHDALLDLASVIGCAPKALSLGEALGLAFGARGRGGKGAAAAHFEPDQVVINLTKTNGAGSLAHEWFHALDNHLARRAGARSTQYASELNGPVARLIGRLTTGTRMAERSALLDRVRSSPYYATRVEMAARGFEAFVISELGARGVVNDYLANVIPEEAFEAVAALRGQPPGGYPYPLRTELGAVGDAYRHLLATREVRATLVAEARPSGTVPAPPDPPPPPASPASPPAETRAGREGRSPPPGPSDTPDFDWC